MRIPFHRDTVQGDASRIYAFLIHSTNNECLRDQKHGGVMHNEYDMDRSILLLIHIMLGMN